MPSTRTLSVVLVAVVLLSGCSMLPGGDPGDSTADGPDSHGFTFVSNTNGAPFEATVTVTKDGDQLLQESVSGDGTGTYVNLSSVDQPGPYEVTVNSTIPAPGDKNRSDRIRVDGALGNETVVDFTYQSVSFHSFSLPRTEMEEPVYVFKGTDFPVHTKVSVTHHGEVVYSGGVPQEGEGPLELTTLPETGVYQVSVTGLNGEQWTNDTVVLRDPGSKLYLDLSIGREPRIEVYAPGETLPRPS